MNLPRLKDLVINTGANVLSSTSHWGGFNDPDNVITGCHHNAAASKLNTNSIHLHFQEQRPNHWWIVIIREWQSTETTEAWTTKCVCVCTGRKVKEHEDVSSQMYTIALDSRILLYEYGETGWGKNFGSWFASYTHTEYPQRPCTCSHRHTHKQFGSLWPQHTERLWLDSPAFYSMLLRLLTNTHGYTHLHRSGHCLQPNIKPQAATEANWSAPLYFQSIYSVHHGLYILIMYSASFS